jgi:hypothetical protein
VGGNTDEIYAPDLIYDQLSKAEAARLHVGLVGKGASRRGTFFPLREEPMLLFGTPSEGESRREA